MKDLEDDSPPQSIITLEGDQAETQWASETLIVFEQGGASRDLWTVDISDPDNPRAEAYLESEFDLMSMVVSPDGSLAAYRSTESGQAEIYVRSFPTPGGPTLVSQEGGDAPFWSPDGNTLYSAFTAGGVGGPEVALSAARLQRSPAPVVLSSQTLFTTAVNARPLGSSLHPEGDRFIFVQNTVEVDAQTGEVDPERLILVLNFAEELRRRAAGN